VVQAYLRNTGCSAAAATLTSADEIIRESRFFE
jgi:hypothetical protein